MKYSHIDAGRARVMKRRGGEDTGYRSGDGWFVYEGGAKAWAILQGGVLSWRALN